MALQPSVFPSSSSSFSYEWPYDVFLSFRGSDTRYGFTGNLYKALSDKGIHTFFDDQELQGGEEITPALVKAIQDSRIAIVVFSVNYASSSFCLHELATIMECVKGKCRLVLPVFYDVDPCDVRHQKGSYGEAMTKHEERFKDKKENVQKWRKALRQAADLSGEHFKLGNEFEYVCIEKIVKVISKKINCVPLHIADYPVGLKFRVLEVNSLLNDGFDCRVCMVGIYGIGGIGKTTLARAVYNLIADQFEGLCFLENVREQSIKLGLVHLQETLLSETLGDKDIRLGSVYKGIPIIKQKLHRKKVLLVLDDVDEVEQLQKTVGWVDWFGFGSKVIITTRDKQLLTSHGIERNYKVEGLSETKALELLGWHAFRNKNIDPSFMDILKHAVTYACGLPLALEVIGSNLSGKSIDECRSVLAQYERIPNKKIQKILEISFDALEECPKKIFLDIACCFNGYNWVEVQDILHARHDVSLKNGISVLVQKSLLMSDKYGYLAIHDLIRDMGREIIRQESSKHLGNRSRLWIPKDVVQVLEKNTGTDEIEIMILDSPKLEKIVVEWNGKTFKKMRNLEILIIRNTHFSQGAKHLPNSLRVLEWWNYPSNSLPSNFYPKKLTIFKLPRSSSMSVGFIENRKFMNLKVLKLDESDMEYIPDVSGVPNLETLSFKWCTNLIKVHESVGFLDKLSGLCVSGCSKLRSFPALMLPCLEYLNFESCSSLENFPEILGHMEDLAYVYLFDTSIKELPYSFTNLMNLRYLEFGETNGLYEVSGRHDLPARGFVELQFPKQDEDEAQGSSMVSSNALNVHVEFRNTLDEFFAMFLSFFRHVVTLDLSRKDFTIIPESIKELCSLRKLNLDGWRELREIRGIPPNIEEFSATSCMSLTILPESFKELCSLRKLTLDGCRELREIRGIPHNIEEFSATNCMSLIILPESFKELCSLRKLTLDGCRELREIRGIPPNIEEFSATNCMSLTILPESFKELCSLRTLTLLDCRELREIRGIPPNIEEFSATNCVSLTILPESFKELCSLMTLTLFDCRELREIRGIPPNIEEFSSTNCISLIPSCRSMILNKEYHSHSGCMRFYLPGGSIPKWFEHSSKNSISFWFRNKLPLISICVVWRQNKFDYVDYVWVDVYINGNKIYPFGLCIDGWFHPTEDHIIILNQGRILSNHENILSENKWNHVVYRVARNNIEGCPFITKDIGIHVHKHESNMEDIQFTNPLLQEKELNMRDFHRDTEREKNLTTLASVETQQGKWLSLHLPQAMNSLHDNVNGDLNSGSADLSKDKGKDLMVYNQSSEENSMHSCEQELLDKTWESNSMKLASTSDAIREDLSCHDNFCTLRLCLDSEVGSDSDSIMSVLASDTDSAGGSDDDSWKRDEELPCLRPCREVPLECENLESNLMQLASTSDTIKGCGKPSRKRKRSALKLDLNTEPIGEVDSDSDSLMARLASDDTNS